MGFSVNPSGNGVTIFAFAFVPIQMNPNGYCGTSTCKKYIAPNWFFTSCLLISGHVTDPNLTIEMLVFWKNTVEEHFSLF